ncbi:MAG: N-acetyl sugar amidotransferase, partial [Candidatus Omnitrophica bacterium]|nr:N-acetyl sugar amidotransferase [Candidatus Omnitrophota bacterium]
MRFCKRCVQPDTRPGIFLDERGVCSGCLGHEEKVKKINWQVRRQELDDILKRFRCKDGSYYDCVVPVSGGKDSMYQVFTMKEQFGMRPLAVTYHYSDRTALGKKNLEALRNLGVDYID